ncbi:disintegrin and metalloproteinase domain-containing protein 29 [Meles meles]|uniref:disintegrin and metalloproteinase domain-containing protein 29 n=1 Tax=Meles meles TaxID=9662 RepID=UPI001E69FD6C|nr:disintegrin and metalloproteinase domain-containing protein 29 [Meles meles]
MRIVLLLYWLGVFLSFCGHTEADHSQYHSPPEVVIPLKILGTGRGMKPSDWLSYSLHFGGKRHIVHIKVKKYLLSRHLPVFTYTDQGALLEDHPFVHHDCYYHGYVEGDPESLVALSSCLGGFRGLLQINDSAYEIKPMTFSTKFEHLIYKMESEETQFSEMNSDFVLEEILPQLESQEINNFTQKQTGYGSWWRHFFIVELVVVVDHTLYLHIKKNISKFTEDLYTIVNIADSIYEILGIRLLLFGLEFWTEKNYIEVNDLRSLNYFCIWKKDNLAPRLPHDTAHLFMNKPVRGMSGLGFVGGMCKPFYSCAIITMLNRSLTLVGIAIAHHIGHNLGMSHDGDFCTCGHLRCIMHTSNPPITTFSNCSLSFFWAYTIHEAKCTLYEIYTKDIFSKKRCGDGIVEEEEECDCGPLQNCAKDACCLSNCTMTYGSTCAHGLCCKDCQLLPSGEMCRREANECDLPEWCDGSSPQCPDDVYVEDGIPCNESAYCYEKRCNDRNDLCKQIFGPEAKSASQNCYKNVNTLGDRFGNCGINKSSYVKCNISDILCGRVQCTNVREIPLLRDHSTVHQYRFNEVTCWGLDYHFGMPKPDIGDVQDGTECGEEHLCIDRKCVHISHLDSNCSPEFCNMRGICNNRHHCHCNYMWDPPNCLVRGNGGSIDSGPPPKREKFNKSYVLWFSLFWLLLLLCCLLYLCLKRKKKEEKVPTQPTKPEQKVPSGTEKPAQKAPSGTEKPAQKAPSGTEKTPQQAPSGTEKPTKKAPSGTAKPAQKVPSGTEKTPQKAPSGTAKPAQKTPSGTEKTPQKAPSGTAKPAQKAPSGTEKTPQKAPSGTEKTPQKAPSGTATPTQKAPSGTATPTQKAPSGTEKPPQKAPKSLSQTAKPQQNVQSQSSISVHQSQSGKQKSSSVKSAPK